MMKKETLLKIIVLSIFTSVFSNSIYAQSRVPGYLGKKNIFSYQPHLYLKSDEVNANIGLLNNITYERVFSKRSAIELSLGYDLSTVTTDEVLSDFPPMTASDDWNINTYSFGLHYKWYNKRRVAPLGGYTAIGFNMFNVSQNLNGVIYSARLNNGQTVKVDYSNESDSYSIYSFYFGFGKTRIIADKFMINYGVNILVRLSENSSIINGDYAYIIERNVSYHNGAMLSFTLGFGFLP